MCMSAKLIELVQNKDKLKETCKEQFGDICPKRIYREGNRIVIDYGTHVVVIPIKRKLSYEQWAERRDRKIMKTLSRMRTLRTKIVTQYNITKMLAIELEYTRKEYYQLLKQFESLKLPTLELLIKQKLNELQEYEELYLKHKYKLMYFKSQYKSILNRIENIRRKAKTQFESYKPMHSIPISQWKSRIKSVLSMLNSYIENGDINGIIITRKINHKDIETVADWHQFLNDLIFDLTEDLLVEYFEYGKEFKKPSIVKILQNELYSFSFDSAMKSIMLWLKTKP